MYYYVTFNQRSIFKDYVVKVYAKNETEAVKKAEFHFKNVSCAYSAKEFETENHKQYYPNGLLLTIN